MNKKTMRALQARPYPNPANLASKLRRIRDELSLMTQQCEEALERIDKNDGEAEQRIA